MEMSEDQRIAFKNIYKTPHIPANRVWNAYNSKQLKSEALILDAPQRRSVEKAIRETCSYRQWRLRAINVRTNHAHVVVSIGETKPEGIECFQGKCHQATARRRQLGEAV
jgi:REP element-mobilizing transposase RayT